MTATTTPPAAPAAAPTIKPLAVETHLWYGVYGAPAVADETDQAFLPDTLKVWRHPLRGWAVLLYGKLLADGKATARLYAEARGDQLPAWAVHMVGPAAAGRDPRQLLAQIERFARDYVEPAPFDISAERDDIHRQVVALATAAQLAPAVQS